jgi:hypothetical protein
MASKASRHFAGCRFWQDWPDDGISPHYFLHDQFSEMSRMVEMLLLLDLLAFSLWSIEFIFGVLELIGPSSQPSLRMRRFRLAEDFRLKAGGGKWYMLLHAEPQIVGLVIQQKPP